jgi:hypothetical protein
MQTPVAEGRVAWGQISRCIEDKRSIILVNSDQLVLLNPKRCIAPAQHEYFQALMRKRFEHDAAKS